MATLRDVARKANVDVSTVSRALNNTSYVHPDTKKRIFAAVKELSYSPNLLARGLKQGKRNTIGIVVPRLSLTAFSDVAQAIEEEATKKGYAVLICHTEDNAKIEKECLNRLRNGFVDGIIIAGTGQNNRLIRDIHSSGIACTQIIRYQDSMLNSVGLDYRSCGYESVYYLNAKGCKEIGLINGNMRLSPYKERYDGYQKALKELRLQETISTPLEEFNVNTLSYGYDATLELLEINPRLDAILAAVDVQGIGAMRVLKERNLKDKIRVMSLTGHAIGAMLETAITAMELPSREIGKKAADITIEEIETAATETRPVQHIVFNSTLVEREST